MNIICYYLYLKRRINSKYIVECICINYLGKDIREVGNFEYFWEREGEVGGWEDGIGREIIVYFLIIFENDSMWMYYFFNK